MEMSMCGVVPRCGIMITDRIGCGCSIIFLRLQFASHLKIVSACKREVNGAKEVTGGRQSMLIVIVINEMWIVLKNPYLFSHILYVDTVLPNVSCGMVKNRQGNTTNGVLMIDLMDKSKTFITSHGSCQMQGVMIPEITYGACQPYAQCNVQSVNTSNLNFDKLDMRSRKLRDKCSCREAVGCIAYHSDDISQCQELETTYHITTSLVIVQLLTSITYPYSSSKARSGL